MKSERQLLQETLAAGETPRLTLDELHRHARLMIEGLQAEVAALHAYPGLRTGQDAHGALRFIEWDDVQIGDVVWDYADASAPIGVRMELDDVPIGDAHTMRAGWWFKADGEPYVWANFDSAEERISQRVVLLARGVDVTRHVERIGGSVAALWKRFEQTARAMVEGS